MTMSCIFLMINDYSIMCVFCVFGFFFFYCLYASLNETIYNATCQIIKRNRLMSYLVQRSDGRRFLF